MSSQPLYMAIRASSLGSVKSWRCLAQTKFAVLDTDLVDTIAVQH